MSRTYNQTPPRIWAHPPTSHPRPLTMCVFIFFQYPSSCYNHMYIQIIYTTHELYQHITQKCKNYRWTKFSLAKHFKQINTCKSHHINSFKIKLKLISLLYLTINQTVFSNVRNFFNIKKSFFFLEKAHLFVFEKTWWLKLMKILCLSSGQGIRHLSFFAWYGASVQNIS